jgi:IS605 OrfB family transposase
MRRSVRIFLKHANAGKASRLREFLRAHQNVVNYFITRFWGMKEFGADLAETKVTSKAVKRFGITARLAQCAAKQAKEIVCGQRERWGPKARIPRLRSLVANLDSRFVTISPFEGHFDFALEFGSGVPKMVVPVGRTKVSLKFENDGWSLAKGVRLGELGGKVYVDMLYEKTRTALRTGGKALALDTGMNRLFTGSDGQEIGNANEFKAAVERGGKRRKSWHRFVSTEIDRYVNKINLDGVSTVVIENLKHVKRGGHGKRGKFSRKTNRLLSFWHYAKARRRLENRCEGLGVRVALKDPAYTSQRCHVCGNIDSKSRKGVRFKCTRCGFKCDADHNGSKNLEYLWLAGAYSLRSLKNATPSRMEGVA